MSDKFIIYLCFSILILLFVVGITCTFFYRRNLKNVIRILGVMVFLMLVAGLYPYYHYQYDSYSFGLTVFFSMCAMLLNSNPQELLRVFSLYDVVIIDFYKYIIFLLLIIAPLFTVGLTLSFFTEKFTHLLYGFRSLFNDSYLFKSINERSLCIAEDVYLKNKRSVILFTTKEQIDNIAPEYLNRIKKINGFIVNDEIYLIKHNLKHVRNYYILDQDGSLNLEIGLKIFEKYNDHECANNKERKFNNKINMWIYTKEELAEIIFDQLYETFNVYLINEEELIAKSLLSKYPLYNGIDEKRLSFLIVGAGFIGVEILKSAVMCSCFDINLDIEFHVIDKYANRVKSKIEKNSPQLIDRFNIKFYECDVKTNEFKNCIQNINPTYVVVTLGSETLNIDTALFIRRTLSRKNNLPQIHALVDFNDIENIIVKNLNVVDWKFDKVNNKYFKANEESFDLKIFGSYEETYSNLRVGANYLDCLSVASNALYRNVLTLDEKNTKEFLFDIYNQVQLYKTYSDSIALSIQYKLYVLGLEFVDDGLGDVSIFETKLNENINDLRLIENRRYEALMRNNGWQLMKIEEIKNNKYIDKLAKKHARLVNDNALYLETLLNRNFNQEDEKTITTLPNVIKLANELYGKNYSIRKRK